MAQLNTDPAAIVAELTDAQRRAIVRLRFGVWMPRKKVAREMGVLIPLLKCRAVIKRGKLGCEETVLLTMFGELVRRQVMQSMIVTGESDG